MTTGTRAADPRLLDTDEVLTAVVHGRISPTRITEFYDSSFGLLPAAITAGGAVITGPAFCRYGSISEEAMELEVGFPVDRKIGPDGAVVPGRLPAGRIARLVHHGAFDGLTAAWDRLRTWITAQGLTPGVTQWEVYLTEPDPQMDPADLRTELNWSVAPS